MKPIINRSNTKPGFPAIPQNWAVRHGYAPLSGMKFHKGFFFPHQTMFPIDTKKIKILSDSITKMVYKPYIYRVFHIFQTWRNGTWTGNAYSQ